MNLRIDGQSSKTVMNSSKVIPSSFVLNDDHRIKSLKVYAKAASTEEQKQHFENANIVIPEQRNSIIIDGLTDLGSSFAFERKHGETPLVKETYKQPGTYVVTDADGRSRTYTIRDYEEPELDIDNSSFDSIHIINELDEVFVGRQINLAAIPEP